jgi:hypothetical protein
MSLENYFLQHIKDSCILTIGAKRTGKSFLALRVLNRCIQSKLFDEYHLVLPQMNGEQNDSYSFLRQYGKNVFIYGKYHDLILEKVDKIRQNKSVFFLIDDATGQLGRSQEALAHIFSTSRHGKNGGSCCWIISHVCKCATKSVRGTTDMVFLTTVFNEEILEDVYMNFLSTKYKIEGKKFADFEKECFSHDSKYRQLLICRDDHNRIATDFNVSDWNILQDKLEKPVEKKVEEKPKPNENTLMRERYRASIRSRRLNF